MPTATVPILSPVDKALGGEALAGKKTALAVVGGAILSILQAVDVVGPITGSNATTTAQVFASLLGGLGGLGLTGKIDRVVQLLGVMAVKPPSK